MRPPTRARVALLAAALAAGCGRSDAPVLRVSRSAAQASVPAAPAGTAQRASTQAAVNV
jgi:hypothetical protein